VGDHRLAGGAASQENGKGTTTYAPARARRAGQFHYFVQRSRWCSSSTPDWPSAARRHWPPSPRRRRLFYGVALPGWPSLIVSVWRLWSDADYDQIVGIYLSRVFIETKQRPYTIVSHVYERSE
jgi:hypothetical protein